MLLTCNAILVHYCIHVETKAYRVALTTAVVHLQLILGHLESADTPLENEQTYTYLRFIAAWAPDNP